MASATKYDGNGNPFTTSATGQVLRGGLTCGEMGRVMWLTTAPGGATLDELKADTGLSGRKLSIGLRYLEKLGRVFYAYDVNAWKWCGSMTMVTAA